MDLFALVLEVVHFHAQVVATLVPVQLALGEKERGAEEIREREWEDVKSSLIHTYIHCTIFTDWYIYKNSTLTSMDVKGLYMATLDMPEGERERDINCGRVLCQNSREDCQWCWWKVRGNFRFFQRTEKRVQSGWCAADRHLRPAYFGFYLSVIKVKCMWI